MDPQEIGKKWIQAIEKNNNLQILRQTDSEFLRSLESSIQFGQVSCDSLLLRFLLLLPSSFFFFVS
jgi:hypothetical protein